MHRKKDAVGEREKSTGRTGKWMGDSGATFYMIRSAVFPGNLQPSGDNLKFGNDTSTDVEGYGSLADIFPDKAGRISVRLDKVAYVPDLAVNPSFLMAAHTREVGFTTDRWGMGVTLLDGRLKFWSDNSGY